MKLTYFTFSGLLLFVLLDIHLSQAAHLEHKLQSGPIVSIDSHAEVEALVDGITFQINISIRNESVREAFEEHKNRERFLTNLLLEIGMDREKVKVLPVKIQPNYYRNELNDYGTNQLVAVHFSDLELYEEVQLQLIENGFDNFSAHFTSTKSDSARKEALKLAMAKAREDAEILAIAENKVVGDVTSIQQSSFVSTRRLEAAASLDRVQSSGSLIREFEQTIPVTAQVKVSYQLTDLSN